MTDEVTQQHRWDKGSPGAQCLDCGILASSRQGHDPCPGKQTELRPRVWVGDGKTGGGWIWCQIPGACGKASWIDWGWIEKGQVFVPPGRDKPTIDPAEMETIRTCGKVDWE